jgi:hypothetical protein
MALEGKTPSETAAIKTEGGTLADGDWNAAKKQKT